MRWCEKSWATSSHKVIRVAKREALDFFDLTLEELEQILTPRFRARQLYQWVYQRYTDDMSEVTVLPKTLRSELAEQLRFDTLTIVDKAISQDGSEKYLMRLQDGHTIEAVLLKMKPQKHHDDGGIAQEARYTLCLSTQVGCKVGCAFCLTAKGGFVRNLTAGEIVAQVWQIKRDHQLPAHRGINLVYMGMGEPLDNLENLTKAIAILTTEEGLAISAKRQTISTSGISSRIDKLGALNLGVHLAISLHAVDNETRQQLIPMNRAYPIESVIEAVKRFPYDTRKRVMFEYLMIKDLNDSPQAAKRLVTLLEGIKSKVNLIYFNPYPGTPFKRPDRARMEAFRDALHSRGITCTIRESKGLDIEAACGQLREKAAKG